MIKPHRGLSYLAQIFNADGTLHSETLEHNLVPIEGFNHLIGTVFHGVVPVSTWYGFIYEGNYTPDENLTAALMPSAATECTAYTGNRPAFNESTPANGSVDNTASLMQFPMTAGKTLYGGGLISNSAKGATSGILMSIVRFATPKVLTNGQTFKLQATAVAFPTA